MAAVEFLLALEGARPVLRFAHFLVLDLLGVLRLPSTRVLVYRLLARIPTYLST